MSQIVLAESMIHDLLQLCTEFVVICSPVPQCEGDARAFDLSGELTMVCVDALRYAPTHL